MIKFGGPRFAARIGLKNTREGRRVANKPLEISVHAEERMKERRIRLTQLQSAVRRPNRRLPNGPGFTERLEREFPPSKTLVVIIEEQAECIRIVTTFWK